MNLLPLYECRLQKEIPFPFGDKDDIKRRVDLETSYGHGKCSGILYNLYPNLRKDIIEELFYPNDCIKEFLEISNADPNEIIRIWIESFEPRSFHFKVFWKVFKKCTRVKAKGITEKFFHLFVRDRLNQKHSQDEDELTEYIIEFMRKTLQDMEDYQCVCLVNRLKNLIECKRFLEMANNNQRAFLYEEVIMENNKVYFPLLLEFKNIDIINNQHVKNAIEYATSEYGDDILLFLDDFKSQV
jgi:hypothetical protein